MVLEPKALVPFGFFGFLPGFRRTQSQNPMKNQRNQRKPELIASKAWFRTKKTKKKQSFSDYGAWGVLIKRGKVVEAEKSIPHQLRLLNLSDGSPYETLHAYVSSAVAPYFKSYVKESGKADRFVTQMETRS